MTIVAAGMHLAGDRRSIWEIVRLLDRQCAGDAAFDLPDRLQRVQDPTDVLRRRDLNDPDQTQLAIDIDETWPPGQYLLRLVPAKGSASYVPLIVRDDSRAADIVVISDVTTMGTWPWAQFIRK